MDILRVEWSDTDRLRRYHAVSEAVRSADSPWVHPMTLRGLEGAVRHGWEGEPALAFLATVDGVDVATGTYETSRWDNHHLAWLDIGVHPEHRRAGHGTMLLEHLLDRARGDQKTSVGTDSWESPAARAFAERHGFEVKAVEVNRRQVLANLDRDELARVHRDAASRAAAYELVRRVGATPPAELAEVAEMSAAINDAPTDDLDVEDDVIPPERVAAYEAAQAGRGQQLYRVFARERNTGALAGHTVVAVDTERPQIGHQHDTSVVRAHRGHRLGVLLKAEMLCWLAEVAPELETIDTWNAESNGHMIGVNRALGYEVLGRALVFQRSL